MPRSFEKKTSCTAIRAAVLACASRHSRMKSGKCWNGKCRVSSNEASPTWTELPANTRELLTGKLAGLWGAATDAAAFDSWPLDKKQGMLLLLERLDSKGFWHLVNRVTNVYGEGGVGL